MLLLKYYHKHSNILLLACLVFISSLPLQIAYGQNYQNGLRSHFTRYTIADGLSQGTIQSLLQDQQGFIWIGTQDGLNRFDGNQFTLYRKAKNNPNSLSDNFIRAIFEDSKQQIWIGTDNGLNQYNPKTQQFTRYDFQAINNTNVIKAIAEDNRGRLWVATAKGLYIKAVNNDTFHYLPGDPKVTKSAADSIRTLFKDKQGNMWVGTNWGLRRYDHSNNQLFAYTKNQTQNSISANVVRAITQDNNGIIWVGTTNGLNRYDNESKTWQHYLQAPANKPASKALFSNEHLSDNEVISLAINNNQLWVGTANGLNSLNIKTGKITHYQHQLYDLHSLSHNKILSLISDNEDNLWIGTRIGLNKFNPRTLAFNHYNKEPNNPHSLSHEEPSRFLKDNQGNLWVGTWGGGLNFFDQQTKQFQHYQQQKNNHNSVSSDIIAALYQDSLQRIWIGTFGAGISIYDLVEQKFSHIKPSATGLSHKNVTAIIEQAQGIYWISTFGGGLNRYDSFSNTFKHFKPEVDNPNSISDLRITTMLKDDQGRLWIGTWDNGLNLYDPVKRQFQRFVQDEHNSTAISHNTINSLYLDSQQRLWIGTNLGLNRYEPDTQSFVHFDTSHGLQNNVVLGVTGDQQGNLWLSSNYGLSRFDLNQQTFSHYGIADGIQGLEFKQNGAYRSDDGELFFGGTSGFNRFFPHQVNKPHHQIAILLTALSLDNKQVAVEPHGQNNDSLSIPVSINHLSKLKLNYTQTNVALTFAPQTSFNTQFLRYRYRIKGLNDQWIYSNDNNRLISLNNIPAGSYQLQISASNHYGQWSDNYTTLDITMTPAPWFSKLAISIYLFVFLFILSRMFKGQKVKRIRLMAEQQQKIDDQEKLNQQLQKIDKLKDEFLANTSHELRTPLNGIIGLTESLLDGVAGQLPDKANQNLAMVVNSGRRLNNLVNDILDFSKLRNQYMTLECKPVDLKSVVEVILTLCQPLVANKPIKLVNHISEQLPAVFADENRLQQILFNLIGNAIKFTEQGKIIINAGFEDDKGGEKTEDKEENKEKNNKQNSIYISVADTGIGITKEQQAHIFSSFHQVDEHTTREQSGTGLGLTICKQLVELHNGQLTVESSPNQGSTFTFSLPVSQQQATAIDSPIISPLLPNTETITEPSPRKTKRAATQGTHRILLVDDEQVNLQVLENYLSRDNYQIVRANNGLEALDFIENDSPFDIVLLDIMMPQMSGYQVCESIRQQFDIEELAVIFLTAKNQVKDLVHCFNAGGNDFIAKPINKPELLSRIETHLRLIDSHRNLESIVKKRTQQLLQAEKLASLGTLTDGIAHEINNPTNFIHVGVQNLDVDIQKLQQQIFALTDEEEDQEVLDHIRRYFQPLFIHLNTIKTGSNRIQTIVKALQTFTQHGHQTISQVQIVENLNATLALIKTKYQNRIEFLTNFAATPAIYCDPAALNQAFMHLINNGCEAILSKQQLPLDENDNKTPLADKLGKLNISCRTEQQHILVTISDNGIGMEPQTLKQIADPFFTTKTVGEGMGLGLSMVYGIIQQHQGEIEFESQPNQGTCCHIKLPIATAIHSN